MKPQNWTYSPSLSTSRDKVRFLIGDINDLDQVFADEEIDGMLSLQGSNIYKAAAALADHLAARYSREVAINIDGLSVSQGDRAQRYRDLAAQIRNSGSRAPGSLGQPFVGGISISAMDSVDADTDRTKSRFKVGQGSFVADNQNVDRQFDPQ